MTQLSPFSQSALLRIKGLLLSVDRLSASLSATTRNFLSRTLPLAVNNIIYVLTVLKDIATFVPSKAVKAVALIVVLSFVLRYLRTVRKHKKQQQQRIAKETKQIQSQTLKIFEQLGPEFEVRESLGPTGPGYTVDEGEEDSCCEDLTHQLHESNDFRDIIFFELMKGYSQAAESHKKERESRVEA